MSAYKSQPFFKLVLRFGLTPNISATSDCLPTNSWAHLCPPGRDGVSLLTVSVAMGS